MFELNLFEIYNLKEMSLSTEIFLSCSILQLTFYAIATSQQRKHGFVILNQQVYNIGVLILGLALLLLINENLSFFNSFSGNNFIINDYLGFASKSVICFIAFLFLILITISYEDRTSQNNFEYTVLVLISILGLLLLCSSNDLITAYLAIELQSVAFYIMAAFKKNSTYSIESGLKYFIIGSLSSAFFLFGSALIYGCLGSLNFEDLRVFISLSSINLLDSSTTIDGSGVLFSDSLNLISSITIWIYCIHLKLSTIISDMSSIFSLSNNDDLINYCSVSLIPESIDGLNNVAVSNNLLEDSILNSLSLNSNSFCFYENLSYFNNSFDFLNILENTNKLDSVVNQQIFHTIYNICSFDNTQIIESSRLSLDLVYIGFIFIFISLFIKLALAPFHLWSLDVYEGSPNTTTVFFAVVPKLGLFVLLTRICYSIFAADNWQSYFLIIAVFSIFIGSVGGLEQRKIKSLLAYSSISHTGYLLLSFSTNSVEGTSMMLYYLVIFMVSSLCFWSIYLFIQHKKNFYFKKRNKELGDLVLLRESNPLLALILTITLFSIAGIPPIVGFLAKIGIFLVAIKSSAYLISLMAILFSVLSTFYYIRVIKIIYFENTLVGKLYTPISTKKALLIAVLALSLIVLCIDPTIIYYLFHISSLLSNY